jgi:succinate dehydrogenase / fumarate reductase flavoprotein subunit
MAAPSWTQFHPTSLPQLGDHQSKLTLMSESLRNDGRIWVPKKANDTRNPNEIPENERDYYLERRYPAFGNLAPRDISSRAAKERIDVGCGVGPMKNAVYLDFKHAIERLGKEVIAQRYGNLFTMYQKITGMNAYKEPMMIAPAAHFSMGGLWVDYRLMSNLHGLFVLGEANFSDHGANRLGANSLLQACVDGYFIAPRTVMDFLAEETPEALNASDSFEQAAKASKDEVKKKLNALLNIKGTTTAEEFHKQLGRILYTKCGLSRNGKDMAKAKSELLELQQTFYKDLLVPGTEKDINFELEKAFRVADYLEMALLIVEDALQREESCGAHFREEYQTPDGEAQRNDEDFCYVSAWKYLGDNQYKLHKEHLNFEFVELQTRSYK